MSRKNFFTALLMGLMMCATATAALPPLVIDKGIFEDGILRVTGIADIYGDGEKLSTAILQYPKAINPKSVSPDDFSIEGRIIDKVFVNDKPEIPSKSIEGVYVILKLRHENSAPEAIGGITQAADLTFSVQQTGTVVAADNTTYFPAMTSVESATVTCPSLERFKQMEFTSSTGVTIPYNIFLPRSYSSLGEKTYPLVVFIADAGSNTNDVRTPLYQGNGAMVFTSKAAQRKNECIVLAPQYTADLVEKLGMMTTDEHVWTPGLELISELIFDAAQRLQVDPARIYGTGQSQGCMANIAISARYPDLFAAQLLVAGQWDVEEMVALKNKKMWIVVCEGDAKAFPGMNAAVERWQSVGANVAVGEKFLDSKAPLVELNSQLKALEAKGADINYSVFAGGNHRYTWSFAYDLDALRDWLFKQSR